MRVALSPEEPEWQHTALYVTARGLTTRPIPFNDFTFEIEFDFLTHQLRFETNDGRAPAIPLEACSVADFYAEVMHCLQSLGVEVQINTMPQEIPNAIPFTEDRAHSSYDTEQVAKFWTILSGVDTIFRKYRAPFRGRHTLVQFFWGSFDLTYSRFSGRPADPPPHANLLFRKAMDAEEVCAGFWFGYDKLPEPAFYCYAYPKPDGLETGKVRPEGAYWNTDIGEFILSYDDMRKAESPENALLDFLRSTFELGTSLQKWPKELLLSS